MVWFPSENRDVVVEFLIEEARKVEDLKAVDEAGRTNKS